MYNKSMARKCESIYVLKSLEVQFLEGLLALAEEWGGHINMKQVTDASPFVYELASLNVDRGTFHGVEVPCPTFCKNKQKYNLPIDLHRCTGC